jgi:hypothetical protein
MAFLLFVGNVKDPPIPNEVCAPLENAKLRMMIEQTSFSIDFMIYFLCFDEIRLKRQANYYVVWGMDLICYLTF